MSKISINLVTWNGKKYIRECLKSLLEQDFNDYFLLIIDNGSADETVSIIEQEFLPVFGERARLIKNKENLGFARAHNQAILWTNQEYVLIINQDLVLNKDFVSKVVKFFAENKKTGSLSPKVLKYELEGETDMPNIKKTDIIDSLGLKIHRSQRFTEIASGEKDGNEHSQVKEIFGPSGAIAVYRREALESVRYADEYFDNDFFSYKEDVDLAYRLQLAGWQSFCLPSAIAYHQRSAKSTKKFGFSVLGQKNLRKKKHSFINYHSYKNHLFVLVKNLSWYNFFRYFPYIIFYEIGKFIYLLFFEISTLASLSLFFKKLGLMRKKRKFFLKKYKKGYKLIRRWLN